MTYPFRTTPTRKKVLAYIEKHCGLFSAQDILHAERDLDKVSLYRAIDLFSSHDLIHPVLTHEGHQYYELHDHEAHHHHVMCERCHTSTCTPCPIGEEPRRHHVLSYTHLCASCA